MSAVRGRSWVPPEIGTMYRRSEDGTLWTVVCVHRVDRQVTLERTDSRTSFRLVAFPFADQLARSFERLS